MKRNSALTVVLMMMLALWMAMGFVPAAAADTCEGYGQKQEVPQSGSGTFDVTYEGVKIGTITWNNTSKTVTWSVAEGYSLDVCVKGGAEGLTTGSGASGTLTPQDNGGDQTSGVSHFAWTVNEVPVVTQTESEPVVEETESEDTVVKDKVIEADSNEPDDEVAVLDNSVERPQVVKLPAGAAATGGGSTSGLESLGLFAVGLMLIAAAAPVLVVARRTSRKA